MFTLPDNYGLPMLSAVCLAFECIMIGFLIPGGARKKVFNKKFLKDNFDEVHFRATEEDVSGQMGYPDMGSGMFSQKLTYLDWLNFNRAQRVHQNLVEVIASMILMIMVGGIEFPEASCALGFILCASRIFFIGYLFTGGPKNPFRMIGAITQDLALITIFVLSIIASVRHI